MIQRCENPHNGAYCDYGGKGIKVCEEWKDFRGFMEWAMANGYDDTLTIERKDNRKGYNPQNCRFATRAEQNRNTTRTHRIKYGDRVLTAAEAGRIVGVDRSSVAKWVRDGRVETMDDVFKIAGRHCSG